MARKGRRIQDWSPSSHRATLQAVLDDFVAAYLEAALWSSIDDDGKPLDNRFGNDDFSQDSVKKATEDAADFIKANEKDLRETDTSWGQHGHDFWLTRNHHGAGFWDRGYGAVGNRLSEAAHVYGEAYIYEAADGKLHFG